MNEMIKEKQLSTADLAYPDNEHERTEAQATDYEHEQADVLFEEEMAEMFQSRWIAIQTKFVDEPPVAVQEADGLVAEVIKRMAEIFAEERSKLETQWSQGEDVSTEDLRLILKRYRAFFQRLLAL